LIKGFTRFALDKSRLSIPRNLVDDVFFQLPETRVQRNPQTDPVFRRELLARLNSLPGVGKRAMVN